MGFLENLLGNDPITALTRFAGGIGTWLSSLEQQNQTDEANQQTDQQIETIRGLAQGGSRVANLLYNQGMGHAGDIFRALPGQYEDNRLSFLNNFQAGSSEINQGYGDRYRYAEDQLKDYGQQQAADIDRGFDEEQARLNMSLQSRGLLSSTEAATQNLGNRERRSAEHRRLGEDLVRNRVDILSGLSGDQLNSQQQLFETQSAWDAAMRGDTQMANQLLANFYMQNAVGRSNLYGAGIDRQLQAEGSFNFIPPPPNQLPWIFGQNSVQAPSSPDMSDEQQLASYFEFQRAVGGALGAGAGAG